jgi:hypothetical protein
MDSMSSGHSSGDHVLAPIPNSSSSAESMKRSGRTGKPIVMPLEDLSDQDEAPIYLRYASKCRLRPKKLQYSKK